MTSFYQALRARLERNDALNAELARIDRADWRGQLDALKAEHGTWKATAEALGVKPRTVERWRNGYMDRGVRKHVNPATFEPKIKAAVAARRRSRLAAWKRDRGAQVAAVDWARLRIKGTILLEKKYKRKENMHVGRYLSGDSIAGLTAAYLAKPAAAAAARCQVAIDYALSWEYIGNGDTELLDVEELDFGS